MQQTISLRSLSREAPSLTEPVLVTHGRAIIGRFVPLTGHEPWDSFGALADPPRVKVGGEPIPVTDAKPVHGFGSSRPAPKR